MGKGIFRVSQELLENLLHLPDNTELIQIGRSSKFPYGFDFVVYSEDIPETEEMEYVNLDPSVEVVEYYDQIDLEFDLRNRKIVWNWNFEEE